MTFYRGTDPRIRIQILTKTPLIRNTGGLPVVLLILWICGLRWSCYRWWNRFIPVTCYVCWSCLCCYCQVSWKESYTVQLQLLMICTLYRSCGPGDEQHPVPGVCGRDRTAGHLPSAPHSGQVFTASRFFQKSKAIFSLTRICIHSGRLFKE